MCQNRCFGNGERVERKKSENKNYTHTYIYSEPE